MPEHLLKFRFRGSVLGLLVAPENVNVDKVTIVHASKRKPRRVDGDESRDEGEQRAHGHQRSASSVRGGWGTGEILSSTAQKYIGGEGGKGAKWSKNGGQIGEEAQR